MTDTNTTPLPRRDINNRAEKFHHIEIPNNTGNAILDAFLLDISERFCGQHRPESVLKLLSTVMKASMSEEITGNELKSLYVTMHELLESDLLFKPYQHKRKLTCFGSARTPSDNPNYIQAKELGKLAADAGYMVITGGGPGIMQAANEGAGPESSFGLNISLPFEQHPNPVVAECGRFFNYYYFFTRKLNLVKQTDALVACPGGFGTMDEIYESITLMQTGKAALYPIILMDAPGEDYWSSWLEFNRKTIVADGLVSPEDPCLYYHCQSAQQAFDIIEHYYSRFHSYYFHDGQLVVRLNSGISEEALTKLASNYDDILPAGDLQLLEGDPEEKEILLRDMPRLVASFKHGNYARLRMMIDDINDC